MTVRSVPFEDEVENIQIDSQRTITNFYNAVNSSDLASTLFSSDAVTTLNNNNRKANLPSPPHFSRPSLGDLSDEAYHSACNHCIQGRDGGLCACSNQIERDEEMKAGHETTMPQESTSKRTLGSLPRQGAGAVGYGYRSK